MWVSLANFEEKEFACPCCGEDKVDDMVKVNIQAFRNILSLKFSRDIPLIINSAYRCPKHNEEVGGVKNSQHTHGLALDVYSPELETRILFSEAVESGLWSTVIYYEKSNFIHLDLRHRDKPVIKYWSWDK